MVRVVDCHTGVLGSFPGGPKDVASDVGVNLCNVKSCLNTSNNEIFTDKRGEYSLR